MKYLALNPREGYSDPYVEIDVTSRSTTWGKALSPMLLNPGPFVNGTAKNVENAWQYSKIYSYHWDDELKRPKPSYWDWREEGFRNWKGIRYPFGKENRDKVVGAWVGKECEQGRLLSYVEAKKELYIPLYLQALRASPVYGTFIKFIADAYHTDTNLVFRDFDVFNHYEKGLALPQIASSPDLRYGHGFILVSEALRFIESESIDFSGFEKIITGNS